MRVEPDGIVLDVQHGERLIEAAWRLGYEWPTTCYGRAECTTCSVEVVAGADHASPIDDDEAAALAALGSGRAALRLACRVRFDGEAVVRKRGVRARAAPGLREAPGVRHLPSPHDQTEGTWLT